MTNTCLYVGPDLGTSAIVTIDGIAGTTERHRLDAAIPPLSVNLTPLAELDRRADLVGVVIGIGRGWVGSAHIRFASRVLKRQRRVWLHWPDEQAFECVDAEKITSLWRHWAVIKAFTTSQQTASGLQQRRAALRMLVTGRAAAAASVEAPRLNFDTELERCKDLLLGLESTVDPLPFSSVPLNASGRATVAGTGIYLRTDYWVSITSGGSYGHTCYVAKELAASTERFVSLMANRYPLLDECGVPQTVLPKPFAESHELALLAATAFYHPILRVALQALHPAYIYERLCLGSFVGSLLSRELRIPHIVEYNGSELSMRRSFEGSGYAHEQLFARIEDVVFRQATMITVVSQTIKDSLVMRGVDAGKILVNPNGADPVAYAPPPPSLRDEVRRELGFTDTDRVIGFTGTFGGWHGIDVLAASIPEVCARAPGARFLLIGDGTHKPMLDEAVASHQLQSRVTSVGRVPQAEGARLLAACDLFVSPHNSHMVDSRFFGSPTKLFEYMAMGGGIVGSDLEQLGEVLSPALRAGDLAGAAAPSVTNERAVLCIPGDVNELTTAVVGLVEHPETAAALGRNARQAVLDCFSWERHVAHVWGFLRAGPLPSAAQPALTRVQTGDAYKEEVQNQWNNNPVGTQYTKASKPHTLEWFKEIEAYRYQQYGPWMPELMEFDRHAGEDVLEIGGGVGTDLSQFARHGARITDLDLSAGHLAHAQENFQLRGLPGRFVHHDAENLPFDDASFDLVYSNGVLHHTPNTRQVVEEIRRVLRPGGRAIVMMYAENSLHYWRQLVWNIGLHQNLLSKYSMGEIMSRHVEITQNDARPLVKVYTAERLRRLFEGFDDRTVYKRQLIAVELPDWLQWMSLPFAGRLMGWNVIIKATKPRT